MPTHQSASPSHKPSLPFPTPQTPLTQPVLLSQSKSLFLVLPPQSPGWLGILCQGLFHNMPHHRQQVHFLPLRFNLQQPNKTPPLLPMHPSENITPPIFQRLIPPTPRQPKSTLGRMEWPTHFCHQLHHTHIPWVPPTVLNYTQLSNPNHTTWHLCQRPRPPVPMNTCRSRFCHHYDVCNSMRHSWLPTSQTPQSTPTTPVTYQPLSALNKRILPHPTMLPLPTTTHPGNRMLTFHSSRHMYHRLPHLSVAKKSTKLNTGLLHKLH